MESFWNFVACSREMCGCQVFANSVPLSIRQQVLVYKNIQHCAMSWAHVAEGGTHSSSSSEAHGYEESGLEPTRLAP